MEPTKTEPMSMPGNPPYYLHRGFAGSGSGQQPGLQGLPGGIRSLAIPPPNIGGGGSAFQGGTQAPLFASPNGGHNVGGAGEPVKRKRGRPRKYGPDGTVALSLSPRPTTPGVVSGAGSGAVLGSVSTEKKRGRGRPPGSGTKQQLASFGEWISSSAGMGFTLHIVPIATGEDIAMKIMNISQQGSRAICVLSATGAVSTVTLHQSANSGGTVTYEGKFEILSLSGSYLMTENGGGSRSRTGGLSISLSSPDGRIFGGGVGGVLIAASPVQVIVGSFIYAGANAKIKLKPCSESRLESNAPVDDDKKIIPSSTLPKENLADSVLSGWQVSNQMESRNSNIDINSTRG